MRITRYFGTKRGMMIISVVEITLWDTDEKFYDQSMYYLLVGTFGQKVLPNAIGLCLIKVLSERDVLSN